MFDATNQRQSRGSVNASTTHVDLTGRCMAMVTLFNLITQLISERSVEEISELDDLNPDSIIATVLQRLLGLPDFEEPSGETPSLRERIQTLKTLRANQPIRQFRDFNTAVSDRVADRFALIRRRMEKGVEHSPLRAKELADAIRQRLDAIRFHEPNVERIKLFELCVRSLVAVGERRSQIPTTSFERATTQLRDKAKSTYCAALAEVVREFVNSQLRAELRNLQSALLELIKSGANFSRNLEITRAQIESEQATGMDASISSPASVVLQLEGPTEKEVFSAMFDRHKCGDPRLLASFMMQRLEGRLRARAEIEAPSMAESGTLGTFLIRLAPETVTSAFVELFDFSLGEGHSLFDLIEKAGIDYVAKELWERAAPLCHLSNRDIPEFNITPYAYAVIRLPVLIRPGDGQIREQLARAIQKHGECTILEASPNQKNAVSVVRILAGWPIAVEASNSCLLQHYAKCFENGHPPHLIGFFAGSPLGLSLAKYVELARHLDSIS